MLLKSLIAAGLPAGRGRFSTCCSPGSFFRGHLEALLSRLPLEQLSHHAAHRRALAHLWPRSPTRPTFAFTLHSGGGVYHGFLWFYFINEQLLRFLNLRYPRDYATVPRLYFWLFHLIWLFPWSVYLPAVLKLSYRP